jgi:hypothetical protein
MSKFVIAEAEEALSVAEDKSRDLVVGSLLPLRADCALIVDGLLGARYGAEQARGLGEAISVALQARSILDEALSIVRRMGGIAALRNVWQSTASAIVELPTCTDVNWTMTEFTSAIKPGWEDIKSVQTSMQNAYQGLSQGSDFGTMLGMPGKLLSGLAKALCFLRTAVSSVRSWIWFVIDKTYDWLGLLSIGTWGTQRPPVCSTMHCMEVAPASSRLYTGILFPIRCASSRPIRSQPTMPHPIQSHAI